jgi:hypothetical protein
VHVVHLTPTKSNITATVAAVLPGIGLADLMDDEGHLWTVTKSTRGTGLGTLSPGARVHLTIDHHRDFSLVCEYIRTE